MAKPSGKKTARVTKSTVSSKRPQRHWAVWVVGVLVVLFLAGMIFSAIPRFSKKPSGGPQFRKEGALQFLNAGGQTLENIDIEIADDDMTRAQGLMWRRSMAENQGMLFIMDALEPQSFWMRNTYIPLDIIFVNEQFQIVKIRANTTPQSLNQVTSEAPARYVVEVNAGFCNRHGIREGDNIAFQKL